MRARIYKTLTKESLLLLLPQNLLHPTFEDFKTQTFTLLQFPIDFQKSVLTSSDVEKAFEKIQPTSDQVILVGGRLTEEARLFADRHNIFCIVKLDPSYTWTDESYIRSRSGNAD